MSQYHKLNTIGIVGAGTMGQGIAQVSALSGFEVLLFDIDREQTSRALTLIQSSLEKGIEKGKVTRENALQAIKKIETIENLEELKANLIIEAAVEDIEIKRDIFTVLERVNDKNTILTTNTSSIPVTQISSSLNNPTRFLGLHFFNPAHIMPLVEIISTSKTDEACIELVKSFANALGKTPVLAKDSPGFIVNRVARHFYVESLKIMEENVAGFEEIDKLLESSGFKMGPFKLMDLIGVDTNYSVTETMFHQFGMPAKFRPSRIQKELVDSGFLGRKSGKGFYDYTN